MILCSCNQPDLRGFYPMGAAGPLTTLAVLSPHPFGCGKLSSADHDSSSQTFEGFVLGGDSAPSPWGSSSHVGF